MSNIAKKSKFNDQFMQVALEEARAAYDQDEIPVGAVITHHNTGEILVRGYNIVEQHHNATMHAEMVVINQACKKLKSKYLFDYDIYITLEPCAMCAAAISHVKIKNLYYGASDAKFGAIENGARYYSSNSCIHRPNVYSGFYEDTSKDLLIKFFKTRVLV